MTYVKKLGATLRVTGALLLVTEGWATSAEGAAGISPVVNTQGAIADGFGHIERAHSVLGAAIPTTLRPTLQQRRRRDGARRVAQPRRGGARVVPPRARGGRTVVRGRGYYSPYYYGYPYGYGYGYPYYGAGYYGYYGGGYSSTGSVRLKVKPRHAEVLVDGYYVGSIDDFDGTFQSLKLEPGPVSIEVRAAGFEALRLDVMVLAGRKITYEENMRAGDPGQAPMPAPRPPAGGPDRGVADDQPVRPDRDTEPGSPAGYDVFRFEPRGLANGRPEGLLLEGPSPAAENPGAGPRAYRSGTKGWPRQAGVFTFVRSRFPEITTSAAIVMR